MVANPERGEVEITVIRDGETKPYVLKMTMNASVAMQKRLGKPVAEIIDDLQKLDVLAIRDLAFMLLQKHHKDEIKTVEQAGDLLDDAGGIAVFLQKFEEVSRLNAGEQTANPPTAQPTTGAPSTLALDVPA